MLQYTLSLFISMWKFRDLWNVTKLSENIKIVLFCQFIVNQLSCWFLSWKLMNLACFNSQADKERDELSDAKSTAHQDDILAVCKLHGFLGTPTIENQLQALDKEYHLLKEQGQSSKADYVQTLYIWLSKKTGKVIVSYAVSTSASIAWGNCFIW